MKNLLKKLAINVVGWTVVVILAFIHSSVLRPLCVNDKIVVGTLIIVHLYVFFMAGRSLFLLYKTERNFKRVMKSILWLLVLAVLLNSGISMSNDALSVLFYGWFGWLIIAFILQKVIVKKQLDQKRYARIGLMVVLSLLAIPKFIDDGPIENDWTFEDIAPSPEVQKSYSQLRKFMTTDYIREPEFQSINCEEIHKLVEKESVLADKEQIEKLWQENQNFINEFVKLDDFVGITDYTVGVKYEDVPFLRYNELNSFCSLYNIMIRLKAEEGNFSQALNLFRKSNSITLKGVKDATIFIQSMFWRSALSLNLKTAESLINLEGVSQSHAKELLTYLEVMSTDDLMVKPIKMEYLHLKELLSRSDLDENFHKNDFFFPRILLQRNKTFRMMKKYYVSQIQEFQKTPASNNYLLTDNLRNHKEYPLEPVNVTGWVLTQVSMPSYDIVHERIYEMIVKNEILRLKLTEMIDEDTSKFVDPYTSKPFVKNKDGEYYSPGPDRKFDTEDDITL